MEDQPVYNTGGDQLLLKRNLDKIQRVCGQIDVQMGLLIQHIQHEKITRNGANKYITTIKELADDLEALA
ncbi:MAG: hypothetical protein AAF620_01080 [Bacteroidota bacterium]